MLQLHHRNSADSTGEPGIRLCNLIHPAHLFGFKANVNAVMLACNMSVSSDFKNPNNYVGC